MNEVWTTLEFWVGVSHWITGIGTAVLAVALVRTFRHLEATTRMSKIETEYRLRPWIGPSTGIKIMDDSINGDVQFSITIKNFGDLPASGVKAKSVVDTNILSKESLNHPLSEFNMGPLLPHMEKSYWFFTSHEVWDKVLNGTLPLYVAIYFEYPSLTGSNGYGIVSEYNKNNKTFVHKDMWLDYPQIGF